MGKKTMSRKMDDKTPRSLRLHGANLATQHRAINAVAIVAVTDVQGRITYVNDKFCAISGYERTELLGNNHRILKSGTHSADLFRDMYRTIAKGGIWRGEVCNKSKSGALYWVDTIIVPRLNRQNKPEAYMSIRFDITARKAAEASLAAHRQLVEAIIAEVDDRTCMLTPQKGADLRVSGVAEVVSDAPAPVHEASLGILGRNFRAAPCAVHLVGLDHFRALNECYGRTFGDKVLYEVASLLRRAAGTVNHVLSLGGDEFAILQSAVSDEAEAAAFARHVLTMVEAKEIVVEGIGLRLSASSGVFLAHRAKPLKAALAQARIALGAAKRGGRSKFDIYRAEMQTQMQARQSIERDLRNAAARREFAVHYQPIIDASTGRMASAEALVRWQHPTRGLVAAGEFIPIAEESGLICEIGNSVLAQACTDAMAWPEDINVAVNLSAVQFRRGRVREMVAEALRISRLPAERLELEITESALLEASYENLETLHQLRALGIKIALDDFGTGYSSLSYLQVFPFDKIKIDRVFISKLDNRSERAVAIVRAVTRLAAELGITVVAEGVEKADQLAEAVRAGCSEVQGYLCGHPRPQHEHLQLVRLHAESTAA